VSGGTTSQRPWQELALGPDAGHAVLVLPAELASSDLEAIREPALWSASLMRTLAEEGYGIPFPRLEIWMLDLNEALAVLAPRVVGPPVAPGDVERIGGQAAAKTMPLADDWSHAAAVVPGAALASGDGRVRGCATFILLHEIGHTLVERLGTLSGARETGWHPTAHSLRKAGNAVRHGLDEWRVSLMASAALREVVTNGDGQPVSIPELMGWLYRDALGGVLDSVYPGWPDAVTGYRNHQVSLEDLYAQVVGGTVDVFTFLSHCQAEAVMLGRSAPLREEHAQHPATRLYLGEPWGALISCGAPLLPPLAEFAEAEGTYLSEVVPKIIEMWRRTGLTFTDGPGPDDLRIDVTAPLRDAAAP
jgi:hypothetical protein